MTTKSGLEIVSVPGKIVIDLSKGFTMQSLYDAISVQRPTDPKLVTLGIDIPIIGLNCKIYDFVDLEHELKEAIARLYDHAMKMLLEPIWKILQALLKALEKFIGAVVDLTLPILNLHISDLFSGDLYEKIKKAVVDLYHNAKDKLIEILKKLGISYPFFTDFTNPLLEIEAIVKKIMTSLWGSLFKVIDKVIHLIEEGLLAFDIATHGIPTLSVIWKKFVEAILQKILEFLAIPPTIDDIKKALIAFAKKLYNKAELTYQELLDAIKHFKLPVFGLPIDWHLPIHIHVKIPNLEFEKLISDMKIWINNYMVGLLNKFVEAIGKILDAFGLNFVVPKLEIPFTFCAARIPG
jgi:hypothetical protein